MTDIKKNKLSIYLIKEEYSSAKHILKSFASLKDKKIGNVGTLYYGESYTDPPTWSKKFFGDLLNEVNIYNASSKAVLLVPLKGRVFALTFGYGHTLLDPGVFEERFGLMTVVNIVDPDGIRKINKKNMSVAPKLSDEQVVKGSAIADFGFDIEQDLMQGIAGAPKKGMGIFGESVTGKNALSVSVAFNHSNVKDFLERCYERYNSKDYKENFEWIDHVCGIKDPHRIDELNGLLIEEIKNENFEKVWSAVPEIIEWQNVSNFEFKKNNIGDDIDLPSCLDCLTDIERENISVETLKKYTIDCIDASLGKERYTWKVYDCLYCELQHDDRVYILSAGKWYDIEPDFVRKISTSFDSLRKSTPGIILPECRSDEHEDKYNERAASESTDICLMDKKLIYYGGAKQKIEFCDLLTKEKQLIHVKKYGSSSVLSHLFAQGLVSGELFLSDPEFRKKVNDKLPDVYRDNNPNPPDYEIIFAVISDSAGDLEIPFFSKINLMRAKRMLTTFRYRVSLLKIQQNENTENDI